MDGKLVRIVCANCLHQDVGIRDKNGVVKFLCPICGTATVSKKMSRRKVVLELTAPKGQEIQDEI